MKERIYTGLMIILVVSFAVLARQFSLYVFDALILAIMIGGAFEASNIFAKIGFYNDKKFVVSYPILLYALFLLLNHFKVNLLFSIIYNLALIILVMVLTLLVQLVFKKKTENELKTRNYKSSKFNFMLTKSVQTGVAMLYPALLLLSFVILNHIGSVLNLSNEIANVSSVGLVGVVSVFVISALTDTFSMLFGKLIGGKKLMPKVSPNKTISGTVGGIAFTMFFVVGIYLFLTAFGTINTLFYDINFQLWHAVVLTFITGLSCNIGDLFESFLKRKAKVKDSGSILPGHGGILDRFDSHSFASVIVLLFFIILLV